MTGARTAVGKSTSLKAKKLISEMKAEDAGRGSANSEPGKAMVFRHTTLQRALKCLATAQGLKPSSGDGSKPGSGLHWSRDAVVLIGTALEKRIRDILVAARDVVTFGGKQTVTERALVFACSINKDCPSVFQVSAQTARAAASGIQLDAKTAVDRLVTPSSVHRLCVLTGIQRLATSQVVPSLRQASRFFLSNIVSNIKSLVELRNRATVSLAVASAAIGSWARLAGFAPSASKRKAAAVRPASAAAATPAVIAAAPAVAAVVEAVEAVQAQAQAQDQPIEVVDDAPVPAVDAPAESASEQQPTDAPMAVDSTN